ncbi:MAG: glycoside hydrolase family 88 protein [Paracholeplasma sp.]|nr:glycoside hydrolase family 88 protein [Paracholeplasma sp.]MDY3196275.1 glycoside hydrolase family 88 protein [Paracholeplasma sp.]
MKLINDFIEKLITESTPELPLWNIESIKHGKEPAWNYVDGCMMTSLLELHKETKEEKYLEFVKNFVNYYVFEDGTLRGYDPETFNLDDICESRILFDLLDYTKEEKYKKAIEKTYHHVRRQPRTIEGNFWHKLIYPQQVWLDGLFMAQPFYTRYETLFNNQTYYFDIINQFKNVRKLMFDENKKLYYHGYDSSKTMFWANKDTGLSANFWLRATGWFVVSIVDVIDYMSKEERAVKDFFFPLLKETVDGLLQYQDKETKLFYQVIDQGDKPGNYLEASGSSLLAYSILKGVRLGALDSSYEAIGKAIFNGIVEKYITDNDGDLNMDGICLVAGLGPDNNTRRDGTFEYYISEPIVKNDAKGVGPFIMAYTEVLKTLK